MVVCQQNLSGSQPELDSKLGEPQQLFHDLQGPELALAEGVAGLPVADFNIVMQVAHGELAACPGEYGVPGYRRFALEEFPPAIKAKGLVEAGQQVGVPVEQAIVQGEGAYQLGLAPLEGGAQTE